MALLDDVKPRIGVFYSEANKDVEVQGMISGALSFYKNAGWIIDTDDYTPVAVDAIALYCKMSMSSDPAQLSMHPVMLAYIAQNRVDVTVE